MAVVVILTIRTTDSLLDALVGNKSGLKKLHEWYIEDIFIIFLQILWPLRACSNKRLMMFVLRELTGNLTCSKLIENFGFICSLLCCCRNNENCGWISWFMRMMLWVNRCQMISQEDYDFIVAFDGASGKAKEKLLEERKTQCAKTFLNLMGHVSKDQTIYYILVLIDDMLQVCFTKA